MHYLLTTSTTMQSKFKTVLKYAAVLLLWLAVWQFASMAVNEELLIPSPKAAARALAAISLTGEFWCSVLYSLARIILGYLSGVLLGVIGGILSARYSVFKTVFSPILHLIRAVPVASFIILAFVFIRSDYLAIFISFLMVLPMVWNTTESSIRGLDEKYLEMAKVFRLSPFKTLTCIKIPFIMPSFIATASAALGFAWKSGVAAEVICKPMLSLGGMLSDAKLYLETPNVFAVTAVVAILSLILEVLLKRVTRRFADVKH